MILAKVTRTSICSVCMEVCVAFQTFLTRFLGTTHNTLKPNHSGGPLLSADGYVVGITSWGFGCGSLLGGVYTRVSAFEEWIQNGICSLSSNPPAGCVVPSTWPAESKYAGPRCDATDPCQSLFGTGRSMRLDVSVLGLHLFCTDLCVADGFIPFFRRPLEWKCGTCS